MSTTNYYLSRVENSKVISSQGEKIGVLKDLAIDMALPNPMVVAARVKTQQGMELLDFSSLLIRKQNRQYVFVCENIKKSQASPDGLIFLKQNVLDRQIVDINGKKIVRVNDIKMTMIHRDTFVVAVDVGLEGLLRRLSFAKPLTLLMKRFKKEIPSKFILWNDIEAVDFASTTYSGIKLSKTYEKLSRLNPSDLADIIEDLNKNAQMAVFKSLDDEQAADVMEELEPEAQVHVIKNLSTEDAADLLEIMPADEVADILDELDEDKAEELLQEMQTIASDEVRELMEYDNNTVGSIMSTDYISFNEKWSVDQAIQELRRLKPESSWAYYLYILDDQEKLLATVSLRDLVVSEPATRLDEIMNTDVIFVNDEDNIKTMTEIISKYNLLCVPVTDKEGHMLGVVVIEDVVYDLLKSRRRRR